jgi:hypothetical protein
MKREITPEQRQAMKAAQEQKAAVRQKRLIVGDWQIYRADSFNIILQKGENGDALYYPDVASALKALFQRMIEPTGKQELAAHLKRIEQAECTIMQAITKAGGLDSLFGGTAE